MNLGCSRRKYSWSGVDLQVKIHVIYIFNWTFNSLPSLFSPLDSFVHFSFFRLHLFISFLSLVTYHRVLSLLLYLSFAWLSHFSLKATYISISNKKLALARLGRPVFPLEDKRICSLFKSYHVSIFTTRSNDWSSYL